MSCREFFIELKIQRFPLSLAIRGVRMIRYFK